MTTHNILVSSAECGECKARVTDPNPTGVGIHRPAECGECKARVTDPNPTGVGIHRPWGVRAVANEHLKAQKDALWEAAQVGTNSDNPIAFIIEHETAHVLGIAFALRAQMEVKR